MEFIIFMCWPLGVKLGGCLKKYEYVGGWENDIFFKKFLRMLIKGLLEWVI